MKGSKIPGGEAACRLRGFPFCNFPEPQPPGAGAFLLFVFLPLFENRDESLDKQLAVWSVELRCRTVSPQLEILIFWVLCLLVTGRGFSLDLQVSEDVVWTEISRDSENSILVLLAGLEEKPDEDVSRC